MAGTQHAPAPAQAAGPEPARLPPRRALTLRPGVALCVRQEQPAQRGQEQQGSHAGVWG